MAIVSIHLKGPLHVGQFVGVGREAALEYVPSDTLFSALVEAWKTAGLEVGRWLQPFVEGAPPFLISSAFPRAGEVRFYPRPWLTPAPRDVLAGKRAKRLRWVSEGVFHRLVSGESLEDARADACFLHDDQVWLTPAELESIQRSVTSQPGRLWKLQIAPRVTVGRAANKSNLFHTGRVLFAGNAGLWFALRAGGASESAEAIGRVRAALDLLADGGLGGLRSTGHGAFTWTWEESGEPGAPPAGAAYAVTLARYAPRSPDEIERTLKSAHAAYQLVTVGGWCRDDALHAWRRKSVRMITEGSVLGLAADAGVYGALVDVTPDGVEAFHNSRRVYRYGFAFPVGVAAQEVGDVI